MLINKIARVESIMIVAFAALLAGGLACATVHDAWSASSVASRCVGIMTFVWLLWRLIPVSISFTDHIIDRSYLRAALFVFVAMVLLASMAPMVVIVSVGLYGIASA